LLTIIAGGLKLPSPSLCCPFWCNVQVAVAAAAAEPPAPPAAAQARLQQYLVLLPKDLLQGLAASWELQVRANASADSLAKALVGAGLQLTDLTVKQLQYICQVEQVARSGTKDEIVQRLEAAAQPAKAAAAAAAAAAAGGDEVAAGLRQRALEEAIAMARVAEALPDKQGADGLMVGGRGLFGCYHNKSEPGADMHMTTPLPEGSC
jgi:hypothetical protein